MAYAIKKKKKKKVKLKIKKTRKFIFQKKT